MAKAQFRPCIDLHDGKVKQIVGGTLSDQNAGLETNFVAEHSPGYFARMYREDRLRGGHIIKLGPGNEAAALEALHAWRKGMQIGGGITPDNAVYYLEQGAESVIVTSCVFSDGKLNEKNLELLLRRCGREHIVPSLLYLIFSAGVALYGLMVGFLITSYRHVPASYPLDLAPTKYPLTCPSIGIFLQ